MKIWLHRVLSLMFIALGIALIVFNYNNKRSGFIETEIVHLQIENHLQTEVIKSEFPGFEIIDISGPEFTEDEYPCLWRAFQFLDEEWTIDTCELVEFENFQEIVLNEKAETNLFVFRDRLIKSSKIKEKAVFNYLGEYNLDIQELTEKDLLRFSTIQKVIAELEAGTRVENSSKIPLKEWGKFVDKYLDPLYDSQCFRYNGKVFGPEFDSDFENINSEITYLTIILKIVGAFLFLLGVFLIRKLYFRKHGIMVNPKKLAVLYDVIVLFLGVPSAWLGASFLLEKLFFIPPLYSDDEIFFMGVFFFCFGIPIVSLFTSRLTSQSIEINSKGILVDSLSNKTFMPWESIESIEFSNEYIVVGRLGMPMPTKLQKSLKMIDKSGNSVLINEPQLKSVKKKIILKFEQQTPERHKNKFMQILVQW